MPTKAKLKRLHTELSKSSQSYHYTQLCEYKGKKLRINIKRDSYDNQSYARIYIFKDDEWNKLASIDSPNMRTLDSVSVYSAIEPTETSFIADNSILIKKAKLILD